MRTPQQALQDALDSGAVAAFIAHTSIDVASIGYNPEKFHIYLGTEPPFYDPNCLWRPTPLTFPTPPPGESWHNPQDVTPKQVGEDYRVLLKNEQDFLSGRSDRNQGHAIEFLQSWNSYDEGWDRGNNYGNGCKTTYRVPASTPFHWDKPKMIPLSMEDIQPCTVFREKTDGMPHWIPCGKVSYEGVWINSFGYVSWVNLLQKFEFSQDGGKTWSACEKESNQ